MGLIVLFAAGPEDFATYQDPLNRAFIEAGLTVELTVAAPPETVDYIVYAPANPLQDFAPFTRCKAVLSLWAGVERIVGNPTLTQPLARMVDPALTQGMVEYVTGHVLRHHLGLDRILAEQSGRWAPQVPPLAQERVVGILGFGALGQAVGRALLQLGFQVLAWAQSEKTLPGIRCLQGKDGFKTVLQQSEIMVSLLPLTPRTENILNREAFAWMRAGAVVINPGRGALIDDSALLDALDHGTLGHATLDVFRTEPLPADHPFWHHPRVTVTPHIAAATRPQTASRVIAENIARVQAGQPLVHAVNRITGY